MSMNSEVGACSSLFSTESLKRQWEGPGYELELHKFKKHFADWRILIPEIPREQSGDESVYSMQGWETEFCQDTPDTSTDSSMDTDSEGGSPGIEFDVASLSEVENPFNTKGRGSSDSSTEHEDHTRVTEIVVEVKREEAIEREFWGDESDSYSASSDQELSQSDFWTCMRCKRINKPIPRFCEKCFQVRKNWFPPRPRRKKKKKKGPELALWERIELISKDYRTIKKLSCGCYGNCLKPAHSNAENNLSEMLEASQEERTDQEEKTDQDGDGGSGSDVVSASKTKKCITCMQGPKNAVFVHGTVGHLCCCYPCAKKVWSSSGKCPVCNRKTNSVGFLAMEMIRLFQVHDKDADFSICRLKFFNIIKKRVI